MSPYCQLHDTEMLQPEKRNETKKTPVVVNDYNSLGSTSRVDQYITSYPMYKK